MTYLIDTDRVVDYLSGRETPPGLLSTLRPDGIAISIVSYSEIYEGIYGSRDPKAAEQAFRDFLQGTAVLGVTRSVAKQNARIRSHLRGQRHPIANRALDLLIAATALAYDLSSVTRNQDDYGDIPGLKLYQPCY
jgi:predicted nucleic acid-binding protein